MRTIQGNMLQSLRDVAAFLDDHAAKLPDIAKTGARQKLDDAIIALDTHASNQTGCTLASRGATQKQKALRTALLRDHMAPIARIARFELPRTPELAPFKMPRDKPTTPKLAAAAHGMADAAERHAEVFTSLGLSTDFSARLRSAADSLVAAVGERSQNRGRVSAATKGLADRLSAGRRIVHVLDAFVKTALQDDPALLASWNAVKRVQMTTGRPAALVSGTTLGTLVGSTPPTASVASPAAFVATPAALVH